MFGLCRARRGYLHARSPNGYGARGREIPPPATTNIHLSCVLPLSSCIQIKVAFARGWSDLWGKREVSQDWSTVCLWSDGWERWKSTGATKEI